MEMIVAIADVKRQAVQAAQQYTDVNDACPYPFCTEAGQLFKKEFLAARTASLLSPKATP